MITEEQLDLLEIRKIYHFTAQSNLASILLNGLVTKYNLQSRHIKFEENDKYRFDKCEDSISLSIGFPNYKLLYKLMKNDKLNKWIVLELNPQILCKYDFVTCKTNAANNTVSSLQLEERKGFKPLKNLFSTNDRKLGLDPGMTTDCQSEILMLSDISNEYIDKIIFDNEDERSSFYKKNEYLDRNFVDKMEVNHLLFSTREYYLKKNKEG